MIDHGSGRTRYKLILTVMRVGAACTSQFGPQQKGEGDDRAKQRSARASPDGH
jgi:hypothetical protein